MSGLPIRAEMTVADQTAVQEEFPRLGCFTSHGFTASWARFSAG